MRCLRIQQLYLNEKLNLLYLMGTVFLVIRKETLAIGSVDRAAGAGSAGFVVGVESKSRAGASVPNPRTRVSMPDSRTGDGGRQASGKRRFYSLFLRQPMGDDRPALPPGRAGGDTVLASAEALV